MHRNLLTAFFGISLLCVALVGFFWLGHRSNESTAHRESEGKNSKSPISKSEPTEAHVDEPYVENADSHHVDDARKRLFELFQLPSTGENKDEIKSILREWMRVDFNECWNWLVENPPPTYFTSSGVFNFVILELELREGPEGAIRFLQPYLWPEAWPSSSADSDWGAQGLKSAIYTKYRRFSQSLAKTNPHAAQNLFDSMPPSLDRKPLLNALSKNLVVQGIETLYSYSITHKLTESETILLLENYVSIYEDESAVHTFVSSIQQDARYDPLWASFAHRKLNSDDFHAAHEAIGNITDPEFRYRRLAQAIMRGVSSEIIDSETALSALSEVDRFHSIIVENDFIEALKFVLPTLYRADPDLVTRYVSESHTLSPEEKDSILEAFTSGNLNWDTEEDQKIKKALGDLLERRREISSEG